MNLENHVIQPAIVGRWVNLTAPTTMVAALVGGAVAGIPGALAATPLVGAAKQLFMEMRGRAAPEPLVDRRSGAVVRVRDHVRSMLPRRRRGRRATHRRSRRDMIPGVPSTSAIAALAVTAVAALAVTVPAAAATTTSAPTTTAPPTSVAPTTTAPPVPSRFIAPDGTFAITLPGVPAATADGDAGSDAFTLGVGEDLVAVTRYPLDAFDGDPAATTSARVDGLLDASGTVLEELARVDTTLWSYPATYFIDELALDTGPTATLYGLVTTSADRATYVVYTDLGGNDADAARAAVQSYTVLVPSCPVPAPPPPPTTTTVATAAAAATTSTSATVSTPSTTSAATAVATTAAPTSTVVPAEVVITAVDGRWQATLPPGSRTTCSASARDGFTVSTYAGALGDDRLAVRVTNVPTAFEWTPDDALRVAGDDAGDVQRTTVDGRDAVRFSAPTDDGGTVTTLAVRDGDQLVELTYASDDDSGAASAAAFLDSFRFVS